MIWSDEARRELPARVRGRRLIVDYFASRCCGLDVLVGDLRLRWAAPAKPIAEEFLPMGAAIGVGVFVQRDLVVVLEVAGGRIAMRGWGWFRRPVIELADGAAWLDFVGACRRRSPLHR